MKLITACTLSDQSSYFIIIYELPVHLRVLVGIDMQKQYVAAANGLMPLNMFRTIWTGCNDTEINQRRHLNWLEQEQNQQESKKMKKKQTNKSGRTWQIHLRQGKHSRFRPFKVSSLCFTQLIIKKDTSSSCSLPFYYPVSDHPTEVTIFIMDALTRLQKED